MHFGVGFRPDARAVPAGETEIVTISLYDASVGVFVPYLGNLSALLDHAAAYSKARNIDPAVLLNMRLAPNMYSLKQQVAEANRHAVVAGALLAGHTPHVFPATDPDIGELKSRISAAIDFVQGLPRAEIIERIEWALDALQLSELRDRSPYALSGGQQQRLVLASTLAMRPPVLVLDEPTAGVDIELRQQLWAYVRHLNDLGTTVVLFTQAERIAERQEAALASRASRAVQSVVGNVVSSFLDTLNPGASTGADLWGMLGFARVGVRLARRALRASSVPE